MSRILSGHLIFCRNNNFDNYRSTELVQWKTQSWLKLIECWFFFHIVTVVCTSILFHLLINIITIFFLRKLNSVDVRKIMMLVPELSTVTLTSMISMTIPALTKILKSLNSDKLQVYIWKCWLVLLFLVFFAVFINLFILNI